MRIEGSQDVTLIRPLLARWQEICHGDTFGLKVSVEGVEQDLEARLTFRKVYPRHPKTGE